MRWLLAFFGLIFLVYVLQFLGGLFLFALAGLFPILLITIGLFTTLRIPLRGFYALFWLVLGLLALSVFIWAWYMTLASLEQQASLLGFFSSLFTTPLGLTSIVLLLALLFSQTRTYAIKASRFFWVATFAISLAGLATFAQNFGLSESLTGLIYNLVASSLAMIPLVCLRWYESWPIVICGAILGAFFIDLPNHFSGRPSVSEILPSISFLASGIVPAVLANMVLMNLIKKRHDARAVRVIHSHTRQRIVKFFVSIAVIFTAMNFAYTVYWLLVVYDYPEFPQYIVLANIPFIVFSLLVASLNWLSLITKRDDIPLQFALIGIPLVASSFLLLSEMQTGLIAKAFWFSCGIETIGGLVTFGLEYYGGLSIKRKFFLFSGFILLMAASAQVLSLTIPLYWGILAGVIGGFIEFVVLYQMENADDYQSPEELTSQTAL